ncbi:30S ribosomal protein S20 [Malacoplasma penetrans]|uniref:Small ribosomal subunit protein bS20 n=1 Tax=Malacoplasma penetrans (strain HF-2) TaxID=272633 RepID=RS20_MALP2|nr:30S ribosomal protein S20 [Malacoplasma penetrans]Q8EX02.1 RecName: Full=Small ribosomal subunit protein bS20; AltName: Full=30S ribosomal protein S20 [Malacoplasma penetrans HF-2]RXY97370.1 30S ribosomal protein S20 [Malacoplasma penetrans]BAC43838.1 ribosomal protein S20 [Malacoplasma penetrans HF-2]
MANIKSNLKRNKQNRARHTVVHSQTSAVKTQIKKTQASKSQKDLSLAYKKIDSALAKGIIKQNKADRLKSRLALNVAR